jgi:DNA-binding HxlR family transcriptional regulator
MEKYIIQKSQKIVSALYLITDFIKDSDAIKWEIREEGMILVSNSIMLNATFPVDREHAMSLFLNTAEKIISYLTIASLSSLISSMNASIITHELQSLVHFIQKENKPNHPPGYILSDSFFTTDSEAIDNQKVDKGHSELSRTNDQNRPKNESKTYRRNEILNLLKTRSNLTVKDFSKIIKDCSEKTIQRELIDLVEKGLVKRFGERRWSTYSLS